MGYHDFQIGAKTGDYQCRRCNLEVSTKAKPALNYLGNCLVSPVEWRVYLSDDGTDAWWKCVKCNYKFTSVPIIHPCPNCAWNCGHSHQDLYCALAHPAKPKYVAGCNHAGYPCNGVFCTCFCANCLGPASLQPPDPNATPSMHGSQTYQPPPAPVCTCPNLFRNGHQPGCPERKPP